MEEDKGQEAPAVEPIGTQEAAKRLGISKRYMLALMDNGRVVGATLTAGARPTWVITVEKGKPPVIDPPIRHRKLSK